MLSRGAGEVTVTASSEPAALLTSTELALFCGYDPVRLVYEIRHASAAAELKPLLRLAARLVLEALAQPSDVDDCCRIGTEMVAAAADACIRLAGAGILAAGIDPPAAPFCWVMFGESARGDLLTPLAPTIAVVYDDRDAASGPEDSIYFAAVAGETLSWFHAGGLDGPGLCWPDGSRPCMPLSEWRRFYCETIRKPLENGLYARREFFDVRPLSGDARILKSLEDEIVRELCVNELTVRLLANDTLANLPPLTFFRGLVLGLDGVHRESFDIYTSAVAPIAAAARVLAIARGRLAAVSTLERLEAAQADFPQETTILREAADAFRIALYYQALAGAVEIDARRLSRFDQMLLKTAFTSIQRLLEFTESALIGEL
jgi:signal-transduction protein with cAMP-binding, CBS, and nucleotidyltransferase domain